MKFKDIFKDNSANASVIMSLIGIAIGILILAVVFTIGPVVGYNVENAVTIPANNTWNSVSGTTSMTNGTEMWAQTTPMLAVAALIGIVGVIIAVLMSVLGGRGEGGV